MKGIMLALILGTSQLTPAQELADKLMALEKEKRADYVLGKTIERELKSEGRYFYVKLFNDQQESGKEYTMLEILVSDKQLDKYPQHEDDCKGKVVETYGDYDFGDGVLEAAAVIRDGLREEYFSLIGTPKKPAEEVYDKKYAEYVQIVRKFMKELKD